MSSHIDGKNIVLGLSGSIAAFRAAEIARALVKAGATVRTVMTDGATKFITPLTFETLTGQPVYTSMFDEPRSWEMEHISWARWGDAILVAPATANVIAKLANGISDDPLTTLCLAREPRVPVIVAPAMNTQMWLAAPTRRNVERLRADGIVVVEPEEGDLACREVGKGRLAEVSQIVDALDRAVAQGDLAGKRILVNAGPTQEPLDAARVLTNPSTGKMGFAIAAAAARRGARVTLVAGPTQLEAPRSVERIDVVTAEEMWQVIEARWRDQDAVIFAAAVADFRPAEAKSGKVKKEDAALTVALESTVDIAAEVGKRRSGSKPILIGFAAESSDLESHARGKCERKGLDLVVANRIGTPDSGFAADTTEALLVPREGKVESQGMINKGELAERILNRVVAMAASGSD